MMCSATIGEAAAIKTRFSIAPTASTTLRRKMNMQYIVFSQSKYVHDQCVSETGPNPKVVRVGRMLH